MGSPISPIIVNLYMEHFERKALRPGYGIGLWMTHELFNNRPINRILDHINGIDPAIKFTVEGTQENGAIPLLDTLVTLLAGNSLSITVYQKPTHTDQYL